MYEPKDTINKISGNTNDMENASITTLRYESVQELDVKSSKSSRLDLHSISKKSLIDDNASLSDSETETCKQYKKMRYTANAMHENSVADDISESVDDITSLKKNKTRGSYIDRNSTCDEATDSLLDQLSSNSLVRKTPFGNEVLGAITNKYNSKGDSRITRHNSEGNFEKIINTQNKKKSKKLGKSTNYMFRLDNKKNEKPARLNKNTQNNSSTKIKSVGKPKNSNLHKFDSEKCIAKNDENISCDDMNANDDEIFNLKKIKSNSCVDRYENFDISDNENSESEDETKTCNNESNSILKFAESKELIAEEQCVLNCYENVFFKHAELDDDDNDEDNKGNIARVSYAQYDLHRAKIFIPAFNLGPYCEACGIECNESKENKSSIQNLAHCNENLIQDTKSVEWKTKQGLINDSIEQDEILIAHILDSTDNERPIQITILTEVEKIKIPNTVLTLSRTILRKSSSDEQNDKSKIEDVLEDNVPAEKNQRLSDSENKNKNLVDLTGLKGSLTSSPNNEFLPVFIDFNESKQKEVPEVQLKKDVETSDENDFMPPSLFDEEPESQKESKISLNEKYLDFVKLTCSESHNNAEQLAEIMQIKPSETFTYDMNAETEVMDVTYDSSSYTNTKQSITEKNTSHEENIFKKDEDHMDGKLLDMEVEPHKSNENIHTTVDINSVDSKEKSIDDNLQPDAVSKKKTEETILNIGISSSKHNSKLSDAINNSKEEDLIENKQEDKTKEGFIKEVNIPLESLINNLDISLEPNYTQPEEISNLLILTQPNLHSRNFDVDLKMEEQKRSRKRSLEIKLNILTTTNCNDTQQNSKTINYLNKTKNCETVILNDNNLEQKDKIDLGHVVINFNLDFRKFFGFQILDKVSQQQIGSNTQLSLNCEYDLSNEEIPDSNKEKCDENQMINKISSHNEEISQNYPLEAVSNCPKENNLDSTASIVSTSSCGNLTLSELNRENSAITFSALEKLTDNDDIQMTKETVETANLDQNTLNMDVSNKTSSSISTKKFSKSVNSSIDNVFSRENKIILDELNVKNVEDIGIIQNQYANENIDETEKTDNRKPRPSYLIEKNTHIFGGDVDEDNEDEFFISSGAVYQSWPFVYEPGFKLVPIIELDEINQILSKSDNLIYGGITETDSKTNLEDDEPNVNEIAEYSLRNYGINLIHVNNTKEKKKHRKRIRSRSIDTLNKEQNIDFSLSSSSSIGTCSDDDMYSDSESSDDSESIRAYKQRHAIGFSRNLNTITLNDAVAKVCSHLDLLYENPDAELTGSQEQFDFENPNIGRIQNFKNALNLPRTGRLTYSCADNSYVSPKILFFSEKQMPGCNYEHNSASKPLLA